MLMLHNLPLITTLATGLGLALIMGFIATKLKLPTIVGYLLAGILIGPYTPGFVANTEIAAEFAEMGVMLLMFGVGLHFSLENLLETRKIALPGALLQIAVATLLGSCAAIAWGWNLSSALVFGLALSVSSTVVLIRALESQGLLGSINGQIAVGWLIVEDIAMVVALVFLPFIAHWVDGTITKTSDSSLWLILALTVFKLTSFLVIMLFAGRWLIPKLLWHITQTGSRELFTLCVIAVAVSIAVGALKIFGISLALGAFFAGMIIRESKFSRRAAEESLPFRDAFAVLFFVSVGMLFNPYIFIEQPLRVLMVVGIIVIGKSIAAALLVVAFRYPLNTALTVSASLAQIGEFSFVLVGYAVQLKLLPLEGQGLILAGALISIAINPLLFNLIIPMQTWLHARSSWVKRFSHEDTPVKSLNKSDDTCISGHVILVGYGFVAKRIGLILDKHAIPYVIIDNNHSLVELLQSLKLTAVFGEGSDQQALIQAHIADAGMLVITTSEPFDTNLMISIAKKLNPKIRLAIHIKDRDEEELFNQESNVSFFISEIELANGISRHILDRFGMRTQKEN